MGMFVQDGSKSANDWLGYVTGKDRLHLIDPERGYILTGNNKAAPSRYYNGLFDISIFTTRASRI
jgi:acyl-homoserine lactone acylase PvdQ